LQDEDFDAEAHQGFGAVARIVVSLEEQGGILFPKIVESKVGAPTAYLSG
jgi:hypothetical protein